LQARRQYPLHDGQKDVAGAHGNAWLARQQLDDEVAVAGADGLREDLSGLEPVGDIFERAQDHPARDVGQHAAAGCSLAVIGGIPRQLFKGHTLAQQLQSAQRPLVGFAGVLLEVARKQHNGKLQLPLPAAQQLFDGGLDQLFVEEEALGNDAPVLLQLRPNGGVLLQAARERIEHLQPVVDVQAQEALQAIARQLAQPYSLAVEIASVDPLQLRVRNLLRSNRRQHELLQGFCALGGARRFLRQYGNARDHQEHQHTLPDSCAKHSEPTRQWYHVKAAKLRKTARWCSGFSATPASPQPRACSSSPCGGCADGAGSSRFALGAQLGPQSGAARSAEAAKSAGSSPHRCCAR
jgi:hypothetical protein